MKALDSAMLKLQQIWDRIGIGMTQKEERCSTVFRHLQGLLDDMVEEEETLETQIMERVQAYTDELKKLTTELEVPAYHVMSFSKTKMSCVSGEGRTACNIC